MSARMLAPSPEGEALASAIRRHLPPGIRVGVDLVEVAQLRARFEGREDLLRQVFTQAELDYSRAQRHPWIHLAARFAAKEAALKAIGSGVAGAVGWREVEVGRDEAGEPSLMLSGEAARRAEAAAFRRFAVSLTHGRQYAVAVVLAMGSGLAITHPSEMLDCKT